ncbi:hypothetical protein ACWFNE_01320 [Cellulomonas sp. NPDC055163]
MTRADDPSDLAHLYGGVLVGVARLAWHEAGGTPDPTVGPLHLELAQDGGLVVDTRSDWTVGWSRTSGGDAWVAPYRYDVDGSRWVLRDASAEPAFRAFVGSRVVGVGLLRDAVGQLVGLDVTFPAGRLRARMRAGDLAV